MANHCSNCREPISTEMWEAFARRHRVYTKPPRLSSGWRGVWERFAECLVRDCGYSREDIERAEWLGFERLGVRHIAMTITYVATWYHLAPAWSFATSGTATTVTICLDWTT
jgi:hypothetical protein